MVISQLPRLDVRVSKKQKKGRKNETNRKANTVHANDPAQQKLAATIYQPTCIPFEGGAASERVVDACEELGDSARKRRGKKMHCVNVRSGR